MTSRPLPWPGGEVLAGWQPFLAAYRPRAVWVYHLLLHHVEALVTVGRDDAPGRLDRLVLEAVASGAALPQLAGRLLLDPQLVGRMLHDLRAAGLVRPAEGGRWELAPAGRDALAGPGPVHAATQRRTFFFTEGPPEYPGQRFLALERPPALPWPADEGWHFPPAALESCLGQPEEWKRRNGFPLDVRAVVRAAPSNKGGANAPSLVWQQIVLDRPEHLPALLLLSVADSRESLVGLAVEPQDWRLHPNPLFTLREGWRETFPELAGEPSPDEWRQAWLSWGEAHGMARTDLEACQLSRVADCLHAAAPRPLSERLNDLARGGEVWLLIGAGRPRQLARLEIQTRD